MAYLDLFSINEENKENRYGCYLSSGTQTGHALV